MNDRMFSVFRTAGSALDVQRKQLMIASENIANANTTRVDGKSGPYRVKSLVQEAPRLSDKFKAHFKRTQLELEKSSPGHLSKSEPHLNPEASKDLGPEMEVIEQEKIRWEYDPEHPDANENGMVAYPDVDLVEEMTRMVNANRLYEANLSVIEAEKQVIKQSLQI